MHKISVLHHIKYLEIQLMVMMFTGCAWDFPLLVNTAIMHKHINNALTYALHVDIKTHSFVLKV